ncbi:MAG: hypothetical protein ACRDRK_01335 [Pseudonocardia sp.]
MKGNEAFAERVSTAPAVHRPTLDLFVAWAQRMSDAHLAEIHTYFGKNDETVLLPYVPAEGVGLVSLYMRADGVRRCTRRPQPRGRRRSTALRPPPVAVYPAALTFDADDESYRDGEMRRVLVENVDDQAHLRYLSDTVTAAIHAGTLDAIGTARLYTL